MTQAKTKRRAKVQAGGILRESSDTSWRTPALLRARVRVYFAGLPFLDPAAPPDNPLGAARFFCGPSPSRVPTLGPLFGEPTEEEANRLDGLAEPWDLPWWLNPPFSPARPWDEKVVAEVDARPRQAGVLLLPVNRTEEDFRQELLARARRVLFVRWPEGRGRVPFESSIDGAECDANPFASWLLGFGEDPAPGRWLDAFGTLGGSYALRALEEAGDEDVTVAAARRLSAGGPMAPFIAALEPGRARELAALIEGEARRAARFGGGPA